MAGIPLGDLILGARSLNALRDQGFKTTDDLLRCGPQQMLRIPNFGKVSLEEVRGALDALGLSFDDKPAPPDTADLEQMFAILEQKMVRHFNEQARNLDERVNAIYAALNATQKANGLDQMMELLFGIRKAIDLRLDDMMLAVRLTRKPSVNGAGME